MLSFKKIKSVVFAVFFLSSTFFTNASLAEDSKWTYDVRASSGTQNNRTYNEIHLGLNWSFSEFLTWRNSVFTRSGDQTKTVNGLDSSLLLSYDKTSKDNKFGFGAYVGPGVRLASDKYSAATGEAGIKIRLGGLQFGVGAKHLRYFDTRKDVDGVSLPKDENQLFITLSGGGSL
ncbi:MAG: hypothetical protein ACLGGX_01060 [Bdellovibrionia bacterium]